MLGIKADASSNARQPSDNANNVEASPVASFTFDDTPPAPPDTMVSA